MMTFEPTPCSVCAEAYGDTWVYRKKPGWVRHLGSYAHTVARFICEHRFHFIAVTPAVLVHLEQHGVSLTPIYGPPVVCVQGFRGRKERKRENPWLRRSDVIDALESFAIENELTQTMTALLRTAQDKNSKRTVSNGG